VRPANPHILRHRPRQDRTPPPSVPPHRITLRRCVTPHPQTRPRRHAASLHQPQMLRVASDTLSITKVPSRPHRPAASTRAPHLPLHGRIEWHGDRCWITSLAAIRSSKRSEMKCSNAPPPHAPLQSGSRAPHTGTSRSGDDAAPLQRPALPGRRKLHPAMPLVLHQRSRRRSQLLQHVVTEAGATDSCSASDLMVTRLSCALPESGWPSGSYRPIPNCHSPVAQ